MKRHIENSRRQLGDLGTMAYQTEAAERRILEQATRRLDDVNARIERARTGVESAPERAQDRYLDLIKERGQLSMVIAKARKVLGQ